VGQFGPRSQTLVGWWPTGVARPKGKEDPWPAMARCGTRPERDRRARGPRGGTVVDGWPVLVAVLGRWCTLEGVPGRAPSKVSDGGAHPSGVSAVRGRSSSGRLCSSMPDVKVVPGGDPGEVLWLRGGGYVVIRHEPIEKEKHAGGAH
jgi:hypothetical protein